MRDELDRLRLAVDEATTQVISATGALEAAAEVERQASAKRADAETVRATAIQRLTEARAALDARLGIVQPVRLVTSAPRSGPALPVFEDDDEPIRDP